MQLFNENMKKILRGIENGFDSLSLKLGLVNYVCPVCRKENVRFNPLPSYYFEQLRKYHYIHSIYKKETLNLKHYLCSHCNCTDRDRLYALYIEKIETGNIKILDIAPSKPLSAYLKSNTNFIVRTADLFMADADDKVDITDMRIYKDESFDAFICSHVLEHIEDDLKAMKELYRILNQGGWGIAMVPIDLALKEIYEDYSIKDEAGRWKHFGQHDHVRMYSKKGFIERLESVGFKVRQLDISFFGAEAFSKSGIHPRSILYVVNK